MSIPTRPGGEEAPEGIVVHGHEIPEGDLDDVAGGATRANSEEKIKLTKEQWVRSNSEEKLKAEGTGK